MPDPVRELQRFLKRARRRGCVTQFEIDDCIRRFDRAKTEAEKTRLKDTFLRTIHARMEGGS